MANSQFQKVRISGLAAAIPSTIRTWLDDSELFGEAEATKIATSTGIRQRHVAVNLTTVDLCYEAAERLLNQLEIDREKISALIFVSQTGDYQLPASACCLQSRLGLSTACGAFDVNLGCSGYVYGLWLASSLIESGSIQKVLLLVGDTISKICSPEDRSTFPIFGDCGTATLLEYDASAKPSHFELGTDGSGQTFLQVPVGGARSPFIAGADERQDVGQGSRRAPIDLYMNGAEVFAFTLKAVPKLVSRLLENADIGESDLDFVVFHQANQFMLNHLYKRLNLPPEKAVLAIDGYGNTSSASIPLALVVELGDKIRGESNRVMLAGFGVGWSWAGAVLSLGPAPVCELIVVDDNVSEDS